MHFDQSGVSQRWQDFVKDSQNSPLRRAAAISKHALHYYEDKTSSKLYILVE
jgi:hypothetical protein